MGSEIQDSFIVAQTSDILRYESRKYGQISEVKNYETLIKTNETLRLGVYTIFVYFSHVSVSLKLPTATPVRPRATKALDGCLQCSRSATEVAGGRRQRKETAGGAQGDRLSEGRGASAPGALRLPAPPSRENATSEPLGSMSVFYRNLKHSSI